MYVVVIIVLFLNLILEVVSTLLIFCRVLFFRQATLGNSEYCTGYGYITPIQKEKSTMNFKPYSQTFFSMKQNFSNTSRWIYKHFSNLLTLCCSYRNKNMNFRLCIPTAKRLAATTITQIERSLTVSNIMCQLHLKQQSVGLLTLSSYVRDATRRNVSRNPYASVHTSQ